MTYTILTPFSLIILTLIIIFVFIDAFVIWMFTGKHTVGFWRCLGGAFLANLITSIMGIFIGFNNHNKENLIWFSVAVLVAIIFEWIFYIPFFRKYDVTKTRLFIISLISNVIVFTVLAFLLFYKTGILTQYFDLSFIENLQEKL